MKLRAVGSIWIFILLFPGASVFAATVDISIGDSFFNPPNNTIHASDTIRWTNNGMIHTTTSMSGPNTCVVGGNDPWDSNTLHPGETFQHLFNIPGTYPYMCLYHCTAPLNMKGNITV